MTQFELWIKACEEFDTRIILLEGVSGETAFYETYNVIEPRPETRWNCSRTNSAYQVWINGKRELVTQNYFSALAFWEKYKCATI